MNNKRSRALRAVFRDKRWNHPDLNYEPGTQWISPNYLFRKVKKTYNRIKNELNSQKNGI